MDKTMYWDIVNAYQSIAVVWRRGILPPPNDREICRLVDCAIVERLRQVDEWYTEL